MSVLSRDITNLLRRLHENAHHLRRQMPLTGRATVVGITRPPSIAEDGGVAKARANVACVLAGRLHEAVVEIDKQLALIIPSESAVNTIEYRTPVVTVSSLIPLFVFVCLLHFALLWPSWIGHQAIHCATELDISSTLRADRRRQLATPTGVRSGPNLRRPMNITP